jgi:hypothetical protein
MKGMASSWTGLGLDGGVGFSFSGLVSQNAPYVQQLGNFAASAQSTWLDLFVESKARKASIGSPPPCT